MPAPDLRQAVDSEVGRHPIPWAWAVAYGVIGALCMAMGWLAFAPIEYVAPVFELVH